jgi:hypothetical protein
VATGVAAELILATGVVCSGATDTDVGSATGGCVGGTSVLTGGGEGATSVLTGTGESAGTGVESSAWATAAAQSQSTAAMHREREIMIETCPL